MCVQSQPLEDVQVFRYFDEPIGSEGLVEFRLLYSGQVLASANNTRRPKEKHAIRKIFNPQLRQLWRTNPNLRDYALGIGGRSESRYGHRGTEETSDEEFFQNGISQMADRYSLNGFQFLPLITEEDSVRCRLEILFLRPEANGMLIRGGDIDGRIKTVFDALRMPEVGEIEKDQTPEPGETPFFVLLKDDSLISEVKVTTDELLLLPGRTVRLANEVFMQIHVMLQVKQRSDTSFLFD
jgi:hypothetical protein